MKERGKELRDLLRSLVKDLGLLQKEKYACCGMTLAQCHCLIETGYIKKATVNELAETLKLDQSTVSRMIEGLVKEGLINRTPGEEDRRKIEIQLSPRGKTSFNKIELMMKKYYEEVLERIPEDKADQVIESLQLLLDAIQNNETSCCGIPNKPGQINKTDDTKRSANMEDIREYIKDKYSIALKNKTSCGCGSPLPVSLSGKKTPSTGCCSSKTTTESSDIPSFGCGFPVETAKVIPGSRILDLGCGAGGDLIRASRKTGPTGKVYGLDMTDSMLEAARKNIAAAGLTNIELLKGYIEDIPMNDEMVDLVISNCVINLSPDKGKVLKETFRVLRHGGEFNVADTILLKPLPEKLQKNLDAWSGCASGALSMDEYKTLLEKAGFTDIHFDEIHPLTLDAETGQVLFSGVTDEELALLDKALASTIVRAHKAALPPLKEGIDFTLRTGVTADFDRINQLLKETGLPLLKQTTDLSDFLLAEKDSKLVGVIGYLIQGHSAILRSMAVQWEFRNRGIGQTLTNRAIETLEKNQIENIYILTVTASQYAEKAGFTKINREDIPVELLQDSGLGKECPSSCVCMRYQ